MASGVPVRLSEALATRARAVAKLQERSVTEQVEHWARLGQAVELAVSSGTVLRLKTRSHDPELELRLAQADTAAGRARAAALIRERDPIRYSARADGTIVRTGQRRGTRAAAKR